MRKPEPDTGEQWRTSKLRFHTAEVAGSKPASPTFRILQFAGKIKDTVENSIDLSTLCAATVQQRKALVLPRQPDTAHPHKSMVPKMVGTASTGILRTGRGFGIAARGYGALYRDKARKSPFRAFGGRMRESHRVWMLGAPEPIMTLRQMVRRYRGRTRRPARRSSHCLARAASKLSSPSRERTAANVRSYSERWGS